MCGIIGVAGGEVATIVDGLRRLEYRGYDSAGVAIVDGGDLWRARVADGTRSVEELAARIGAAPAGPATGIGHTRWATHGEPTEHNAHPHLDCTGRVALVHNGIVENHAELAVELADAGHTMASGTDTEVLAHLVEAGLAIELELAAAVAAALRRVRGSFAVAVVHAGEPDLLVVARRSAPLLVGTGPGSALVASDLTALLGRVDAVYALDDDQVAEVRSASLRVTTLEGTAVEPTALPVDPTWDLEAAQKGGYADFMTKEMHEQPRAVADTLLDRRGADGRLVLDELRLTEDDLRDVDKVVVVACGSSYHAGMVAKYAIERWARLPTEVDIASEHRYRDPVLGERTLVVGVSQSGETLDTLEAVREAQRSGARALVVSNVVHSQMAREADGVVYTRAGPEVGVASTKCHLAQVVALELLALSLAQRRCTMPASAVAAVVDELHELPGRVDDALARAKDVEDVAEAVAGARDFFFLGRHVGYPVALEGALKLKEISYLRAEGYPAGELKHGPIALIEPGTVVVAVVTAGSVREKVLTNMAEVASRGATVVAVAEDGDAAAAAAADHVLWTPRGVEALLSPVVAVVPLQLLAYSLARRLGNDVDRPRNLAKTVTVE
ncbi:MAG: glutamine--fructose-6-phosphate transaminase (isomerizing) [Acidimicrobiales bacterium]